MFESYEMCRRPSRSPDSKTLLQRVATGSTNSVTAGQNNSVEPLLE